MSTEPGSRKLHYTLKDDPDSRPLEQVVLLPVDVDVYEMSAGGVKEEVPDAQFLLGGVHPTFMWQEILDAPDSPVDFIIRGESEQTVDQLMRVLSNGGDPATVPGIVWRTRHRPTSLSSLF